MNKSSFGGQPVLLLFALLMIAGAVTAGMALVWTNQQRELIGLSIKKLEGAREELRKDNERFDKDVARFTEQISLEKYVNQRAKDLLRRPTADQIIQVRTNGSRSSVLLPPVRPVAAETSRFGVMDIAFTLPGPVRDRVAQ